MPSAEFENLVQMFKAQRSDATPSIPELRTGFDMLGQMMPVAEGVQVEQTTLGGLPTDRLKTPDADETRVLLYLHGGGYCIGTRASHRPVTAALAKATGIPVLLPEYRLAPEAPFPAAVDDARAVYEALLETHAPERIVVAGESAGGGLTASLLVNLRDDGRPLPAAAVVISPWCDLTGLGRVSDEALATDFLTPEVLVVFADSYERSRPAAVLAGHRRPQRAPTAPRARRRERDPVRPGRAARRARAGVRRRRDARDRAGHVPRLASVHAPARGAGDDQPDRGVRAGTHARPRVTGR
jgi:acetyl esterase/lipase